MADQLVEQYDVEDIIRRYGDTLFRICLVILRSEHDAEDVLQDTLLRYIKKAPDFASAEHEKAWLIRVATNRCRDALRFRRHYSGIAPDMLRDYASSHENIRILDALMRLSPKYKSVLHLHYVEGYKAREIARMVGISEAAVKKRLQRGRELLRQAYERE